MKRMQHVSNLHLADMSYKIKITHCGYDVLGNWELEYMRRFGEIREGDYLLTITHTEDEWLRVDNRTLDPYMTDGKMFVIEADFATWLHERGMEYKNIQSIPFIFEYVLFVLLRNEGDAALMKLAFSK
jgi:hypothetical protein